MRFRADSPEELARPAPPWRTGATRTRQALPGSWSPRSATRSTPITGRRRAGCCWRSTGTGLPESEVHERGDVDGRPAVPAKSPGVARIGALP